MPGPIDRQLTCPNGHTFIVNDSSMPEDSSTCPQCGVETDGSPVESSTGSARSLWEVMGQRGESTDPESNSDSDNTNDSGIDQRDDAASSSEFPDSDSSLEPERPRGLWAMMGAAPSDTETANDHNDAVTSGAADEALNNDPDDIESDGETQVSDDASDEEFSDDLDEDDDFELADDDEDDGWEVDSPLQDFDAADSSLPLEDSPSDTPTRPVFPRGTGAAAAGVLSVLLAGLNLLPSFLARLPATVVGAYALLLGYQALGNNRRLRETAPKFLAPVGMFLGLVGIFAGPVYLVELGESWRHRSSREVIESNLGSIHQALTDYSADNGHFPAGGTFAENEDGQETGMHGWMTSLLPYLGHTSLYHEINLSTAWNDEANVVPMSRPVPNFLVPSVPHEPTGRGFATTHFAGVGGVIQTEQGLLPTGIFDKNSATKVEDISDGLSQTLIAGEIARALPAWGNPENWRTIEGPLNQRLSSFGNAAGTGAYFLQGDGSVRFFSNRTSPEVMQKMATRNAGD